MVERKFGYLTFEWGPNTYAVKLSSAGNPLWKRFASTVGCNRYQSSWQRVDSLDERDCKFMDGINACIELLENEG